jgi:tellurite resistance protein TehA-like permease
MTGDPIASDLAFEDQALTSASPMLVPARVVLTQGRSGLPTSAMPTIGTSLFLIAVGAILKFAVTLNVAGIDLHTVGVVLMVVGCFGLVLGLYLLTRSPRPSDAPPL